MPEEESEEETAAGALCPRQCGRRGPSSSCPARPTTAQVLRLSTETPRRILIMSRSKELRRDQRPKSSSSREGLLKV